MGRPAGSKNKAKDAAAHGADPAPGPGDNSKPVPSPDVIAAALAEITDIEVEMASLSGRKGAIFNRYEAQGVDRDVLKGLVKLAKGSKEEAAAYLQTVTKYAVAAHVITVADAGWASSVQQADMFAAADGEGSERVRAARARKEGFQAGKKGHDIQSSKYQSLPGSVEFVSWRDGWQEGKSLRAVVRPGSENVRQASTSKRRAEPPRKGADPASDLNAEVAAELAEQEAAAGASVH